MDDLLENAHAVDTAMKKAHIEKSIAIHYTRKQKYNQYMLLRNSFRSLFVA